MGGIQAKKYDLDGDNPDNDVEAFMEDREDLVRTIPLGDDSVYGIVENTPEYVEKAERAVGAVRALSAFDRDGFRGVYRELSGDGGSPESGDAVEPLSVMGGNGDSVYSALKNAL